MDQNRLNNLLLLISTSLIAAGCSDDGGAGLTAGSTGDDGGDTTGDSADSITSTPTASASASGATTSPSTTSEPTTSTTDEPTTGPTSPTEGSSSDPSDTEGTTEPTTTEPTSTGTTEPTTTGETTEGSSGSSESGSSSSGGSEGACADFGTLYAECYADGDPEAAAAGQAYCEGTTADAYEISDECGMAQLEIFACVSGLTCKELGTVGEGSDCDEILASGIEICNG